MGRYYPLNYETFGANIKAALAEYYGSGVTFHSVEALSITFSCPQICDRPIKIATNVMSSSYEAKSLICYVYPDDTLESGVKVTDWYDYLPGTFYGYHLVLSKKFLLLQTGYSARTGALSILVARASNDRCLVISGAAETTSGSNSRCLYTDKMAQTHIRMDMMPTANPFVYKKQLLLRPVFFGEEYQLDMNEDGTVAYIEGLYSCGTYEGTKPQVGANYYLSVSSIRSSDSHGTYAPGTFYIALDNDGYSGDVVIPATRGSSVFISAVQLPAANWVGTESPYSQVVTIPGVTANSQVDLTPSAEQLSIFHNKDLALVAENDGGVVTVYAIGQKPENDYTMQVTVTEVVS